jgi:two-component system, OmpR family, phosphate regulon sensor histidine kinase PhoR
VVKKLFGRGERKPSEGTADLQLAAERGRALIEESREIVVVLDADRRVLGASRRAREALEGVVEGAAFPVELETASGRVPLEVSYDVDGRRETLLYLSNPGDLAAYQELRAGFTAAVSHELRTPLARLLALLDTALLPGADQSELIDQARAEVDTIRELIDDVLFLSELESGRAVVSLGSIRARSVIQQVVTGLAPGAERAGIGLEVDCPASFELPLRQRMLGVVVENLVANAIRYAGEGATCSVKCEAHDGRGLLIVSDNGLGVPNADLSRLFERFYRGDRGRSTRGTGLGLAIVKHVVAAAGGSVEASRTAGRGLTVTCSFPAGTVV